MQKWAVHPLARIRQLLAIAILVAPIISVYFSPQASAIPQVQERFNQISDSTVSQLATHRFGFRYTDFSSSVGSVSFEFCSNSPIPEVTCVMPSGLDVGGASLASQSGQTGFTISGADTSTNKLVITRSAQVPTGPTAVSEYRFDNIMNPDSVGSYYVRIQTFGSSNGSGAAIEDGGVVFAIIRDLSVSAEVPPFLLLCAAVTITGFDCSSATSFFIDFGEFSLTSARAASSEFITATNASYGFSVSLAGTTLTSGNNEIQALTSPTTSNPGTSQFGLNLRSNTNPSIGNNPIGPGLATVTGDYNQVNRYKFVPGDAIVSSSTTSDSRKYTVSYLVNIDDAQAAGIYATTVSIIALASF